MKSTTEGTLTEERMSFRIDLQKWALIEKIITLRIYRKGTGYIFYFRI